MSGYTNQETIEVFRDMVLAGIGAMSCPVGVAINAGAYLGLLCAYFCDDQFGPFSECELPGVGEVRKDGIFYQVISSHDYHAIRHLALEFVDWLILDNADNDAPDWIPGELVEFRSIHK